MRGWIDGVALHLAKPYGDRGYFRSAKAVLRKLHRPASATTISPRSRTGCAAAMAAPIVTDFQLAMRFKHRNLLFRIAAYEDLRHLLKHKLRYAPEAISAAERRVLARKSSSPASGWRPASGSTNG